MKARMSQTINLYDHCHANYSRQQTTSETSPSRIKLVIVVYKEKNYYKDKKN